IMAVVQVQNVCDPTNTANVWVANFTGVDIETITKRTLPFQTAVAIAATILCVAATPALFGTRAFASVLPPARADALPAGLFVPAHARDRIAVGSDGSALAGAAETAVVEGLRAANWTAFPMTVNPNASDCTAKPYAAFVDVSTSKFSLIEGTDLDVGLRLEDCGGWIVNEWHDHRVFAQPPAGGDAAALAREGVDRMRQWMAVNPQRAASLLHDGVAWVPGDAPTYFYTLFKTVDGNMRLYVRGGGPAYAAGLRSGDVVNKIDGKWWWEYGTFQAQQRAYDGKPHAFEIVRNGVTENVALGEPFHG